MMKKLLLATIGSIFVVSGFAVQAETRYVDDQIKIWTRTGPSNEYRVRFTLLPGAQLEILQTDPNTGFHEVRDENGRVGWISGELVTKTPTAFQRLASAEAEVQKLKGELNRKTNEFQVQLNQLAPLEKVNLDLQQKLAALQAESEQSKQQAQLYKGGFNRDAFFGGAAVLFGGIIFGWVISKLGGRRRNDGWN